MRHMKGDEMKRILTRDDYLDPRPTRAARFFLGKVLCVRAPDGYAEGMITETEAYGGIEDAASHAFGNRRTARTEIMYAPGGAAYVYFVYGMHRMFNIVTGPRDSPMAVLVRAVKIISGHEVVRQRRKGIAEKHWASGPGRVCAALGIEMDHNCHDLLAGEKSTPRIGVDYAGEIWAKKPWRFVWSPQDSTISSGKSSGSRKKK
jgi:DNA-3-methyladenine glycosylase